jgi:hypothetical protein
MTSENDLQYWIEVSEILIGYRRLKKKENNVKSIDQKYKIFEL